MRKYIFLIIAVFTLLFSTITCYAVTDPAVTIVNPTDSSTIYSTNLLISVKIAKPATIRVSITEEKKKLNETLYTTSVDEILKSELAKKEGRIGSTIVSVPIGEPEFFTSANNLSFYTRKYENVSPGVYRIKVETMSQGQPIFSSESLVTMKEKEPEVLATSIFTSSQSGATLFLQNLLKTIFGN